MASQTIPSIRAVHSTGGMQLRPVDVVILRVSPSTMRISLLTQSSHVAVDAQSARRIIVIESPRLDVPRGQFGRVIFINSFLKIQHALR